MVVVHVWGEDWCLCLNMMTDYITAWDSGTYPDTFCRLATVHDTYLRFTRQQQPATKEGADDTTNSDGDTTSSDGDASDDDGDASDDEASDLSPLATATRALPKKERIPGQVYLFRSPSKGSKPIQWVQARWSGSGWVPSTRRVVRMPEAEVAAPIPAAAPSNGMPYMCIVIVNFQMPSVNNIQYV